MYSILYYAVKDAFEVWRWTGQILIINNIMHKKKNDEKYGFSSEEN